MKSAHDYKKLIMVLLVTIMLPIGLGFIYSMGEKKHVTHSDITVFTLSPRLVTLNDQQLVDYLSKLPLQLKFSRVYWQDGKLMLDLKGDTTITHPAIIYADMYKLLYFAFMQTINVNRVQLRIVTQDEISKEKYILLAMDVLQAEADPDRMKELQKVKQSLPKELENAWRIIYTPHWMRQFPSVTL